MFGISLFTHNSTVILCVPFLTLWQDWPFNVSSVCARGSCTSKLIPPPHHAAFHWSMCCPLKEHNGSQETKDHV
jgi:hypothetical protein